MKKIPQNHAQNNFSHQNLSVKNKYFAMVHIHTKIPAVHDQSSLGKSDQNPCALLQLPIWNFHFHTSIPFDYLKSVIVCICCFNFTFGFMLIRTPEIHEISFDE